LNRQARTERFIMQILPAIHSLEHPSFIRGIIEILTGLNSGFPPQIAYYREFRFPQIFQRASSVRTNIHILLHPTTKYDIHTTPPERLSGHSLLGRFFTPSGMAPPRGSVWLDGKEVQPLAFGEPEAFYLLSHAPHTPKRFSLTIRADLRDSLSWFVVQCLEPNAQFMPELALRHGLPFHPEQTLFARTSRCQCVPFDVTMFMTVTCCTGQAICPMCGIPIRIPDLVAVPRVRRPPVPPPPPPKPRESEPVLIEREREPPVLAFAKWAPIEVREDTPEEVAAKWGTIRLMCSHMRKNLEPKGGWLAIPTAGWPEIDELQEVACAESTEEYIAQVEALMALQETD
jgi:hypothetical protein